MSAATTSYDPAQLQALDAAHHLHPFTVHHELARRGSRVVVRAEGAWIETADGRRLLDGMAGLWCVNVGYGREELVQAGCEQLRELPYYNTFFQCTTPPATELAAELARLLPPGMTRIFFGCSGSDANDTAIKSVWYYWNLQGRPEKKHIISRRSAYHGTGLGSGSLTGLANVHGPFDLPLARFHHIGDPHWYRDGGELDPDAFGRLAASWLEAKILELGPEKVAAFWGEPIQGAGGAIIPPASYWPEIERICRRYDVLLVADEVITGFGRTGRTFGFETFGFTPDIVVMAKGLSSGYQPISAVAFGPRVGEALFHADVEYAHGITYAGHPVACRVALANLRLMAQEGLFTRASGPAGVYFRERLMALEDHPLVGEVRVCGFLAGIELVADKASRRLFPREWQVGLRARELAIEEGLVMRAVGDTMILAPPLTLSEEEMDFLAAAARRTFDRLAAELRD